jgi:hypothetical protein
MPSAVADRHVPGLRASGGRRVRALVLLIGLCAGLGVPAQPQQPATVEVLSLAAERGTDAIVLEYLLRVTLPSAVEDAARRGVPLYFVASASLWRPRWYWRDDRLARVRREWRLTYQPLTSTWRVSQGGLGQSHETLSEAMAVMTRGSAWRIADAALAEADGRHYVEFEWVLDTSQLPRPLQIGVTGVGGGNEWALGVERSLRLEGPAPGGPASSARTEAPK